MTPPPEILTADELEALAACVQNMQRNGADSVCGEDLDALYRKLWRMIYSARVAARASTSCEETASDLQ